MMTIECLKCHKALTIDKQNIEEMKFCPFCMNPLREECAFDQIDSFGKAIYQAVKKGKSQGMNPKAIKGILLDETSRNFETELSKFNRVLGDKHLVTVINVFESDLESANRELNKLETILTDVEGFHPKWVEETLCYCREAIRYYHGENLQVKLNYIVLGQETLGAQDNGFPDDAIKLMEEADKYYNGQGVPINYEKAYVLCKKAAEQGYAIAQYCLGTLYHYGNKGVEQDYGKALEWYHKAAEQGHVMAQHNLGIMYELGQGVARDYAIAFDWVRKAAEQGHAGAQYNLSIMYTNGWGVAKDVTKAFEWNRKSAVQGYARAQYNLGRMYNNGTGVPKNQDIGFEWIQKAAEQGYDVAQFSLGNQYFYGNGVSKDEAKAREWYQKAAKQGNENAKKCLEKNFGN